MGRTPTPLVIWVDPEFLDHEAVRGLADKGHAVVELPTTGGKPDLILSRAAWNWDEGQWPYLEVALRAARVRKKESA
jgi:hypothetical protein